VLLHRADRLVALGNLGLQTLQLEPVALAPRLGLDDDRPERRKLRAQAVAQRACDLVEVVRARLDGRGGEERHDRGRLGGRLRHER
jgi:hypothetical protein